MTERNVVYDENDPYVKIGKVLRTLREVNGLTIEQLSEIVDVSSRTISNLELGKTCMTIDMLVKLSDSQAFKDRTLEELVYIFIVDVFENHSERF